MFKNFLILGTLIVSIFLNQSFATESCTKSKKSSSDLMDLLDLSSKLSFNNTDMVDEEENVDFKLKMNELKKGKLQLAIKYVKKSDFLKSSYSDFDLSAKYFDSNKKLAKKFTDDMSNSDNVLIAKTAIIYKNKKPSWFNKENVLNQNYLQTTINNGEVQFNPKKPESYKVKATGWFGSDSVRSWVQVNPKTKVGPLKNMISKFKELNKLNPENVTVDWTYDMSNSKAKGGITVNFYMPIKEKGEVKHTLHYSIKIAGIKDFWGWSMAEGRAKSGFKTGTSKSLKDIRDL